MIASRQPTREPQSAPATHSRSPTHALSKAQRSLQAPSATVSSFAQASGSTAVRKEVTFRVTDFFDYTVSGVKTVLTPVYSEFLASGTPATTQQRRVKRVRLFCLPLAVNADTVQTTFVVLYSVPVTSPGGGVRLASTRSTVVKPDFNIQWKEVGSSDLSKVWDETVSFPLEKSDLRALFRFAVVDADSGADWDAETSPIQFAYVVEYAEELNVQNTCTAAIHNDDSFDASLETATLTPSSTLALVEPLRLGNAV